MLCFLVIISYSQQYFLEAYFDGPELNGYDKWLGIVDANGRYNSLRDYRVLTLSKNNGFVDIKNLDSVEERTPWLIGYKESSYNVSISLPINKIVFKYRALNYQVIDCHIPQYSTTDYKIYCTYVTKSHTFDNGTLTAIFRYYRSPIKPTLIDYSTPTNIFNEGDYFYFKLNNLDQSCRFYVDYNIDDGTSWSNFVNSTSNELGAYFNLSNITKSVKIRFRIYNYYIGGNAIVKNSEYIYINNITVYPRRPVITSAQGIAPSCNGGKDGQIKILNVNGALSPNTTEIGAVKGYKVELRKFDINNNPQPHPFTQNYAYKRYFTTDTVTLNSTYFTGSLPAGKYRIQIENVYYNGSDTFSFSNGHTYFDLIIPEKPILSYSDLSVGHPTCYGNNDGSLSLKASGGNPNYKFELYKNGILNTTLSNIVSNTSTTFNNLQAGTYKVKIIDQKGCYLSGGNQFTSEIVINEKPKLVVKQDSLKNVLCNGGKGKIQYTISGGTKPTNNYYYEIKTTSNSLVASGRTDKIISNLIAGDYKLYVTDANSCPLYTSENATISNSYLGFTIMQPTAITVNSITKSNYNGYNIRCNGGNDGTLTVNSQGGTGNHNYFLTKSGSTQQYSLNNIQAGTYFLHIKDANNCQLDYSQSITYNEPTQLQISATTSNYNGYNVRCNGSNDGTVTLSATGGVQNYNFYTGTSQITNQINNLYAGTYNYRVKDKNECTASIDVNLTQPNPLFIDSIVLSNYNGYNVKCYEGNDGQIKIIKSKGGVAPYLYSLMVDNNIQKGYDTNTVFSNLSSNNYSLSIKDKNNCITGKQVYLTQPTKISFQIQPLFYGDSPFNISCFGNNDGMVKLIANGGVAPYKYGKNILNQLYSFFENDTIKGLKPGLNKFKIRDKNLCYSEINEFAITQPEKLEFLVDTNKYFGNYPIRCNGMQDSITVRVLGGFGSKFEEGYYKVNINGNVYYLSNFDTIKTQTINANTRYKIGISDANNCEAEAINRIFYEPEKLEVSLSETTNTSCFYSEDGAILIAAMGGANGFSYKYLLNDTLEIISKREALFEKLSKGNKIVKIADTNNCEITKEFYIDSPTEVEINVIPYQPLCYSFLTGQVYLTAFGGTPYPKEQYKYVLQDKESNEIEIIGHEAYFDNVSLGQYKLYALDYNNCTSLQKDIIIDAPDSINVDLKIDPVTIFGESNGSIKATLSGGAQKYLTIWRDSLENILAQNVFSIDSLKQGMYSIEVWDTNFCPHGNASEGLKKHATVTMPEKLEIEISFIQNCSYPNKNDGILKVAAKGGVGGYLYKLNELDFTPVYVFDSLKPGIYKVFVKDKNGAIDSLTTTITEPDYLSLQLTTTNETCVGYNNGTVEASVSGGTKPYRVSIDSINFVTTYDFSQLQPGTYKYFVADSFKNVISKTFIIKPADPIEINIISTTDANCGQNNGSCQVQATGGVAPYSYFWQEINVNGNIASNIYGGQTYTVVVTDANLCNQTSTIAVNNIDGPTIETLLIDQVKCFGGNDGKATLQSITGQSPFTIQWSNGQTNVTTAENLAAGQYYVTVKDAFNCSVTKVFDVTSPQNLTFSFSTTPPTCFYGNDGKASVSLSGGTAPYTIYWTNVSENPLGNSVQNLVPDYYFVKVVDANSCVYNSYTTVPNTPQLKVFDVKQKTICGGQKYLLNANNAGSTYSWTSNNGFTAGNNQIVEIFNAGNYFVSVTSPKGCIVRDTFHLDVSSNYLQANFILPDTVYQGDTLAVIEISWQVPDSIRWIIPNSFFKLSQSNDDIWLYNQKTGNYKIGMTAFLGQCSDFKESNVTVLPRSAKKTKIIQNINNDDYIKYRLYPNPNNGMFSLFVHLDTEDNIKINIYDLMGKKQTYTRRFFNLQEFSTEFNLSNLQEGIYIVNIATSKGTKSVKFIKIDNQQ